MTLRHHMTPGQTLRRLALVAAVVAGAALLSACGSTVASRPDYVAAGLAAPIVQGPAVIVMDDGLQNQVITAHPTSYTGSATTITFPIGAIIRDVGQKVFGVGFSGGSSTATEARLGAYGVKLLLNDFSFKYDQLSSLGFEIRPKVTIGLSVVAVGPDGAPLFSKRYEKVDYLVASYAFSSDPAEKINQALHMALGEIFREILDDVVKAKA